MSDSIPVVHDLQSRIAELEAKLQDAVELLHLWKNEALAYRKLVEAVLEGEVSPETARMVLAISDPDKIAKLKEDTGSC